MALSGDRCRCGAALPVSDSSLLTCPACGRVTRADDELDRPDWTMSSPPLLDDESPLDDRVPWVGRSLETTTVARRAKGCGLLVVGVVFLVALAIAINGFVSIRSHTDADRAERSGDRIVVAGSVVPLGAGAPVDVLAVVQDYTDASHQYLARLDLRGRKVMQRWRSPELPSGTDRVHAQLAGTDIVVAFDDQLWVLDAARGATRWKATLSSQVASDCDRCLAVVDDHVVVRTVDAYLTGYGIGGTEPLWHRRLASTSAGLVMLGSTLAAVDESPDVPGAIVRSIDPKTGADGVVYRPVCRTSDPARASIPLSLGDAVQSVPGTGDAVSVSAYGDGCVVRWEVATGTLRWATRVDGLTFVDGRTTVLSAEDLVVARSGGGLLHVDLTTGATRSLDVGSRQTARPALLVGRQILAWTTAASGGAPGGLEAFDLASGRQQWGARLPGDPAPATVGTEEVLSGTKGRAVLVPGANRVDVVIFTAADHRVDIGRLDLITGAVDLRPPLPLPTRYDRAQVSLTGEAAAEGTLVVTVDDVLERIDPASGAIATYP